MRLGEIINQSMRTEHPKYFLHYFYKIQDDHQLPFHNHGMQNNQRLVLKVNESQFEVHIGIFDQDDIIAYLSMHQFHDGYQVDLTTTDEQYQRKGIIRYCIEYATQKYKKIYSDSRQTDDAENVWYALIKNPNNSTYYYHNIVSNETIPIVFDRKANTVDPNPWNDSDDVVISATPRTMSDQAKQIIKERAELDIRRKRPDRLLGGDYDFFNP